LLTAREAEDQLKNLHPLKLLSNRRNSDQDFRPENAVTIEYNGTQ
jgi:hemin uptake protein HemP